MSFAPLAFKLFYAARQNAVLRRSSFPSHILTCQGYLHVIDKVLFYDDAGGSDGALGTAVGVAAGAVALGAALL